MLATQLTALPLSWREARYAAKTSDALLRQYWIVAAIHGGSPPREIYRRVVMARAGCDADEAGAVLRRAEQSFASWPTERELTFCDVVHYIAVSEYLAARERISTRIDMGRVIASRIPEDL